MMKKHLISNALQKLNPKKKQEHRWLSKSKFRRVKWPFFLLYLNSATRNVLTLNQVQKQTLTNQRGRKKENGKRPDPEATKAMSMPCKAARRVGKKIPRAPPSVCFFPIASQFEPPQNKSSPALGSSSSFFFASDDTCAFAAITTTPDLCLTSDDKKAQCLAQ